MPSETAFQTTSAAAYREHRSSGKSSVQRQRILNFIAERGGDWSIGELANALDLQKSTVSARVNELVNETRELVEYTRRKDKLSGITIRPVGMQAVGQVEMFQ